MPRRKKRRLIFLDFPMESEGTVEISLDELEALRLADVEGMNQNDAARLMGVSQPTFHRILRAARRKAGLIILHRLKYELKGGDHIMRRFKCSGCEHEWEEPFGTGKVRCPKCGSSSVYRLDADRGRKRRRRCMGRYGGRGGRDKGANDREIDKSK